MIAPTSESNPADGTLERPAAEFQFGEGKISGVAAVFLGWLGLGGVIALRFPEYFSTPDMRPVYPLPFIRLLIDVVLFGALGFGIVSVALSRRKSRGLLGIGLAAAALALGGSRVPIDSPMQSTAYLALDWFLLSILILALIFIPLERLFARLRQRIFRKGWRTDLAHFGVSHVLMQATVFLTMLPAAFVFHWAINDGFQAAVQSQPTWLQFIEAMFVADLFAYVAHRLFHEIPVLCASTRFITRASCSTGSLRRGCTSWTSSSHARSGSCRST